MKRILIFLLSLVAANASPRDFSVGKGRWVGAVSISPDSAVIAAGCSDGKVALQDASEKRREIKAHKDCVVAVAFSPDGKQLATGSFDHTASIWDTAKNKSIFKLRGHRGAVMSVAFSADGKLLATGSIDSEIRIWDTGTGKQICKLAGHKSWVNAVMFDANGKLVSGSSDGTIKIWNAHTQSAETTIDVIPTEIRSIAVTKDGTKIAAGLRYGAIKLFENGKERWSIKAHDGDAWSVAFAADDALISGGGDWKKPGAVKFWNSDSGALIKTLPHTGEILAVAVPNSGKPVVAGAGNGEVRVW